MKDGQAPAAPTVSHRGVGGQHRLCFVSAEPLHNLIDGQGSSGSCPPCMGAQLTEHWTHMALPPMPAGNLAHLPEGPVARAQPLLHGAAAEEA